MTSEGPIVVAGMHRSGTSLISSVLAAMHVDMGHDTLVADRNNVRGYFEDIEFLELHRRILNQCSRMMKAAILIGACASESGLIVVAMTKPFPRVKTGSYGSTRRQRVGAFNGFPRSPSTIECALVLFSH